MALPFAESFSFFLGSCLGEAEWCLSSEGHGHRKQRECEGREGQDHRKQRECEKEIVVVCDDNFQGHCSTASVGLCRRGCAS